MAEYPFKVDTIVVLPLPSPLLLNASIMILISR
jgi:hypothetical protein